MRAGSVRTGLGSGQHRPAQLAAAPGPAGTGLARAEPMAQLVAVARGSVGDDQLRAGARPDVTDLAGCAIATRAGARLFAGVDGAGDGKRHRHDLCLATHHSGLARLAGIAELSDRKSTRLNSSH